MNRTYKIQPRPADLGGGWHLKLYENTQEAGGGVYPIREEDPHVSRNGGMASLKHAARTGS